MRHEGYITVPRSINDLPFFAGAILHRICHKIAYRGYEHPTAGMLRPGELVTSISTLVKWLKGPSVKQVRDALDWLKDNDYIEVEATHRYTKIYVIWAEFAALNGYNIMLKDKAEGKVKGKAEGKLTTSATCEDSASCEDEKNMRANQRAMSSANQRANINNKEINNAEDNIHTHSSINLVETKSAPARDTRTHTSVCASPAAVELLEWMARYTPDLMAMQNPITLVEADELLRMHDVEDIRRILTTAWSKQAYAAHRSTKALCDLFIANDRLLQQKRSAPSEAPSLMTYTEMLDAFSKIGGNMSEHFEAVPQPNGKKPLWRRIS
ncbi:MAG: hypothetical protein J6U45_08535 [Alistipes sp.]|nr:hypothetical protein [Alistipes sp.]